MGAVLELSLLRAGGGRGGGFSLSTRLKRTRKFRHMIAGKEAARTANAKDEAGVRERNYKEWYLLLRDWKLQIEF